MRYTIFFVLASLCLLPSAVGAAEPSRGTVIMVSSIGGWVLFSSGSVLLREQRKAREKALEAAKEKEPHA
jgi:hypothetical protein